MRKLSFVVLGLLLVGCGSIPALQRGESVAKEPATVTEAIEPQRSDTPTTLPVPTEPPVLPTSTVAPTEPSAPSTPTVDATLTPRLPTPTPIVYVVQAGDTLAKIAARFQVSVEAIAAQNGITDVNQIEVGQVLTMPNGAVPLQVTEAPEAPAADTPLPARTVPPDEAAPAAEQNWPGICHPSLAKEGARVADLPIGETVELTGYLYLKVVARVANERIVFSFCPAPSQSYDTDDRMDWCTIHAWIPRNTAGRPNHVREYGDTWFSVVILDTNGREIRGWTGRLDSRHVRIVGIVIQPYGTPSGLGGSHTIEVTEIELLENH